MSNGWKGLPIVIFGIGGFASEVALLIEDLNRIGSIPYFEIKGFVAHDSSLIGSTVHSYPIIAANETFNQYMDKFPLLAVTIGLGSPGAKELIWANYIKNKPNLVCPNLIHPRANVGKNQENDFNFGAIICAGVTLTCNCKFGKFVTYNINSTLGHDSITGDFVTVNPLAVISGKVDIGSGTLIGAGSAIRENIKIGRNSTVGMGAVVVKDVPDFTTVVGVAAKPMEVK